ncbi:FKBP-type peptidyl-prolyl cis-trans isomerase [Tengunoibacter tsumagoiensis]|uniref:Peptidyl-prolyl cis-trans isomerase n=1 Tax=Tengunoibacter tsumagoiensis TaxID=2014871 RepID=A0A402A0U2_9CHLR|nr:FKBP-type peptidyl-prolyl cis-trans isomerase [Tengunoibacter tsumagoiensis]GCE12631.1 hypothetical protein KTT_24900 [Tengunoibacter tsumagoiensis]
MAQTMKDPPPTPRKYRPGQRQQERLQRQARRRRRWQIAGSIIAALLLIAVAILGILQYQRYSSDQVAAGYVHATATAHASITPTPVVGAPTPPADTPPQVSGTPVKQADGLEYIDTKVGVGPAAKAGDSVDVLYTGWVQSTGKKFDSSYDDGGKPFNVSPLGQAQIIPGWNEGLIGMKSGGTRRLIIPASLAYGAQGQGPIPPNATLIFDVTVVAINK